ncbi:MAG: flippase-like domain-containing protein [Anaerolineae bacterium]|nr:flippase-like domain-containing protein [Anaerolineae bacterium]
MTSESIPTNPPAKKSSAINRKLLWRIASLVIALLLVSYMLSRIQWSDFAAVLGRLSPLSVTAGFIVYLLLNLFRSFRYIALLDNPELPVAKVYPISLYHNFFVRLLPFKLGEVVYIILMRNRLQVRTREGISSLFGSRLLELLVIVLVAAVSLLISGNFFEGNMLALTGVIMACIIGGLAGFYYSGSIIRITMRIVRSLIKHPVVLKIADKFDGLALELDKLHEPRIFLKGLFWSLFTYGCSFAVNAILLYSVGVIVDPFTLVMIVSLGMFATAFPFSISGFGAVELSFAFGLTAFLGYSDSQATSIGLMINGLTLIYAGLSGFVGFLAVQWQEPEHDPDAEMTPWWQEIISAGKAKLRG